MATILCQVEVKEEGGRLLYRGAACVPGACRWRGIWRSAKAQAVADAERLAAQIDLTSGERSRIQTAPRRWPVRHIH